MIYIVDGTGEWNDDAYEHSMAGGFCRGLQKKTGGHYYRGPTLTGIETPALAAKVALNIGKYLAGHPKEPIFLAGHSRGGAAVIWAASLLSNVHIFVDAMFLFDAVDRTLYNVNLTSVTKNVKRCYHAMRDSSISSYYSDSARLANSKATEAEFKYNKNALISKVVDVVPNSILKHQNINQQLVHEKNNAISLRSKADYLSDQDSKMKTIMRSDLLIQEGSIDFGNCGINGEPGCKFLCKKFFGSHGAIGGAPVIHGAPDLMIDADRAAMACVDSWMSGHLCREGVLGRSGIRS